MRSSTDTTWTQHGEEFEFAWLRFSVDEAKLIIESTPRPVEDLTIEGVSQWLGPPPALHTPGRILLRGVIVDWTTADTHEVDLTVPIIIARIGESAMPIDGWRRIAKATLKKVTVLPAVFLTHDETRRTMDPGHG